MILLTVSALLAAASVQPADTTVAPRNAYTSCLRQFVRRAVQERIVMAAFETQLPQQCQTEEAAFRAAVIRRETGFRVPRAAAEQTATEEVDDSRANFRDQFDMSITPR